MTPRIAAIDCGSNTIKLLIGSPPRVDVRESRTVRLGQGVDASGRLSEEALARTFAAIEEYAALIAEHQVGTIRFCATSATRDCANADEFAAGVRARLGVSPEVLSGPAEAALAFDGAVRNLRDDHPRPTLVVDIGGGSTELILGSDRPTDAVSMDIGSVRLTERHLHSDPPTSAELDACVADIEQHLDSHRVELRSAASLVGVAGTVITVASGVLDLAAYDPERTDQAQIGVVEVHAYVDRLSRLTVAERLALPYMARGRADVIIAGALILDRVLRRVGLDSMTVSEADILDGIAWSLTAP